MSDAINFYVGIEYRNYYITLCSVDCLNGRSGLLYASLFAANIVALAHNLYI